VRRDTGRYLVLYCRDCSAATCEMCFIQLHNGHRYAAIDDVADQLRSQMDSLLDKVESRAAAVSQQLETVDQYRAQLTANVNVRPRSFALATARPSDHELRRCHASRPTLDIVATNCIWSNPTFATGIVGSLQCFPRHPC